MLHEQTSYLHLAVSLGLFERLKGFTGQKSYKATLNAFLLFSGGGGGVEDFQPALVCTVFSGWTRCSVAATNKALISACNLDSLLSVH